ncbi:restriction endonuclease subunit S [Vibrio parahaemolyticus]
MTKQMNVPKLRFGEFDVNWQHYSIKETISALVDCEHKTAPYVDAQDYMVVRTNNIKNGSLLMDDMKYTSKDGFDEWTKRAVPSFGDILFTREAPAGESCLVPKDTNLCLGQRMVLLQIDQSVMNSVFISQLLLSPKVQNTISSYCIGSTVTRINIADINRIDFDIPTLPEQQKIASFLSKVDEKITLLTEKKAKLTEYKKGVMQQLFDGSFQEQDGKLVFVPPTLRFKADDGSEFPDWEEKTFGDISDIKRGASPRPISDPKWFDANSNVGWVRISDVTRSGRELLKTEQYLTEEGIKKSRLIPVGSMIMSICATIGKPIYTTFPVCIHDGFVVFSNLSVQSEYIYYYLVYIEKNWYRFGQPGSQVNLNTDIVGNEIVRVPSQEEQIKIVNFLSAIDQKIDLASSELEKVKEWKKGLLQQMFV